MFIYLNINTYAFFLQIPRASLDASRSCAIYFGLGIHYMTKAMSQQDVALMFSDTGWVCFRGFDPVTRAPMLLPNFLMPSVPTVAKSTWKNKSERVAAKAEKLAAKLAKLNPSSSLLASSSALQIGSMPLSLHGSGGGAGEGASPSGGGVAVPWPHTHQVPGTPPTAPRKKLKSFTDEDRRMESPLLNNRNPPSPGQPKSREAIDSKSGKGQRRRRSLAPIIKASQRCGVCKPCMNPGWKKACDKRRAEFVACQVQQVQITSDGDGSGGGGGAVLVTVEEQQHHGAAPSVSLLPPEVASQLPQLLQ